MKVADGFAGMGGSSEGATMAGAEVVWTGNHWPVAVELHARNHPGALHVCQDMHQVDPSTIPAHDGFLASPCCQGHSPARGKANGNPQHDSSRATAWSVIAVAEYHLRGREFFYVMGRDGETALVWAGRGQRPRWVQQWLDEGGKLEQLAARVDLLEKTA